MDPIRFNKTSIHNNSCTFNITHFLLRCRTIQHMLKKNTGHKYYKCVNTNLLTLNIFYLDHTLKFQINISWKLQKLNNIKSWILIILLVLIRFNKTSILNNFHTFNITHLLQRCRSIQHMLKKITEHKYYKCVNTNLLTLNIFYLDHTLKIQTNISWK